MNQSPEDPMDALAAEYVLGTLRGAACARFEERLAADPGLAKRVAEWETRLAPLADGFEPATAPEETWSGIERRLFSGRQAADAATLAGRLAWWRRLALGFGAVAALFVSLATYLAVGDERPQCYAVLTDERMLPAIVVFDRRNMQELVVLPVGPRLAASQGSAQLWIVAGARSTLVGTISPDRETRLVLDKPMQTAVMVGDARLTVTLEAEGGSASGQPGARRLADGAVALLGARAGGI